MKNIKLLKFILIFAVFVSFQLFNSRPIIERYLDNKNCNKNTPNGATHRPWSEAYENWKSETRPSTFELYQKEMHKFVVLHYTAETNVNIDEIYTIYNDRGVSAHYTLNNNGTIFHTVNEGANIAYHAGPSSFAGKTNLNYYSIGIEHLNPGGRMDGKKISGFLDPKQFPGDNVWWYPFTKQQFKSSMQLIHFLQKKYKIPGWYVVTHADIAPSRKSDIGPMWDHKKAFDDYGVGYFPNETHQIDFSKFSKLSDNDYLSFIEALGYKVKLSEKELIDFMGNFEYKTKTEAKAAYEKMVVKAYQLHFSTANISGELVDSTKKSILKHIIAVYDHTDKITGKKFDFFRKKFKEWAKDNSEKSSVFREYFDID